MRWFVLAALLFGPGAGAEKTAFRSDFTELVGPECVVASGPSGGGSSAECPGLMGYRIYVDREDGRVYLRVEKGGYTAVVPEDGALRFTSKLEWRRKGAMPLALIVRAVVPAQGGGEREVVLLQGLDGNVRMKAALDVKQVKNAEGRARALADRGRATPR
jgi:hypothetical protein